MKKIWDTLWPLAIYIVAQNAVAVLGITILKIEQPIWFVLIAALICIPVYYAMYKNDRKPAGEKRKNIPIENQDIAAIAITGAALALALNNIISLTPLPRMFPGFEDTNEVLYGGSLWLQMISAGMFACIVEEISMRGVVYLRMKRYWGKKTAMVFSALVFGLYHFNVVQAVYAFCMGLFFVWLFERYESLWAPIIGHMSANLFVLLLSASEIFGRVMTRFTGYCLVTCISLLVCSFGWRYMKQTNPLIELEFVEKEPDTLEGLLEAYQHQEREEK